MKVLHIITGLNQGGAESILFRLAIFKQPNVNHIIVSMMDFGVYGDQLKNDSLEVHTLEMPRGHITISGLRKLWKLIRKEKPDVVQTWMYHADLIGGAIARLAGCSSIVWGIYNYNLHSSVTKKSTRLVARLCALTSRIIPKAIISCAESSTKVHISMGYACKKFVTIPTGYDFNELRRNETSRNILRNSWGVDANLPLLGCVARWDPLKNHGNLLGALAILQKKNISFRCVLVGPGIDKSNYELNELILKNGLSSQTLKLAGFVDDIPSVMSAFDLHILPSLGEAFPNVVIEAMACGTPCVVTDVGDTAIMVGDTGWVIPPADSDKLANAIITALNLMKDSKAWEERKAACRSQIVRKYGLERMVDAYHTVWQLASTTGKPG
ncbi:MAG: glycosyltransferase [Bacteroidia bacterium]|nr:glycosyltransferase [Bacteroidia bacterium]